MRYAPLLALGGIIAAPASAAADTITVILPKLRVAEYHNPYFALWVEPTGGGTARTLAIWYSQKKGGNEPGTKWLSNLRAWWRKGGRSLALPADGVSGATRAPGSYTIPLPADLKAGDYTLYVEAARETGGRELLSLPIAVPAKGGSVSGKSELGTITLSAR